MDQHKTTYLKSDRKKVGSRLKLPGTGKDFLKRFLKVQASRPATNNVRSHEAKMLLYSKGHHHLSKGAAYKMGKSLYQLYI